MQQYVVELSKYIILGFACVYTLSSCFCLIIRKQGFINVMAVIQNILILGLTFLCFIDLTFVSGDTQYLYFFIFLELFLLVSVMLVTSIYDKCNKLLLNNMLFLLSIGLSILSRLSFSKAVKQYIIILISFAICLLIPFLIYRIHFFKKLTWIYGFVGAFMLGVVLIMGELTYGANISFSIAGITFQPSEFVKIIFIFFLAALLWNHSNFGWICISALCAGIYVIILVFSNDLGSALIFFVAYVTLVFLATGNPFYLLAGAGGGGVACYIAYRLFPHVRIRVLAWQDPWTYIDNEGYQITQSLFAITNGSWFGMGLMQGNPTSIPFVNEDFIFAAICEEFGVLFAFCILLICLSCFVEILLTAAEINDRFYQMILYGIGTMYIFQVFLTVGGGVKFIPLTGVTLPFISYGGSSVMTTMFLFFIVQGIYYRLQTMKDSRSKGIVKKKNPNALKPDKKTANASKTKKSSRTNSRTAYKNTDLDNDIDTDSEEYEDRFDDENYFEDDYFEEEDYE